MNGVRNNIGIDGRKLNVAEIYVEPKLKNSTNDDIYKKLREYADLDLKLKTIIRRLSCLVFET